VTIQFTPSDLQRFMSRVVRLPGQLLIEGRFYSACWLWLGARSRGKNGSRLWYGSFRVGRRVVRAHRFSCVAHGKGEPPPGWDRGHICDNALCVNPEHLELVPRVVNQQQRMRARQKKLLYTAPIPHAEVSGQDRGEAQLG